MNYKDLLNFCDRQFWRSAVFITLTAVHLWKRGKYWHLIWFAS